MKKKWVLLTLAGLVIVLLVLGSPRSDVLVWGTLEYFLFAREHCTGFRIPQTSEGEEIFAGVWIHEIKPYTVITSQGRWYPGDEYFQGTDYGGQGLTSLLFAGKNGAIFVVSYPVNDPVTGYSRVSCKWYVPVGYYRE